MSTPKKSPKSTPKRSHHAKPKPEKKAPVHKRASGKVPSTVVFSARLKEERLAKKVSQAEFAKAIGITISYVSMLENGKRSPTLDTIDACADALRVRPATLLEKK